MKLPCLSEEGGTLTYICPMRGGARGGTVTQFGPMRQAEGGSTWLCACCLMEVGEEWCLLKEPLPQIIVIIVLRSRKPKQQVTEA